MTKSGRSTEQMRKAPLNAIYVIGADPGRAYFSDLAFHLGRSDLKIVGRGWLTTLSEPRRANDIAPETTHIVVDHAADLTPMQREGLERVMLALAHRHATPGGRIAIHPGEPAISEAVGVDPERLAETVGKPEKAPRMIDSTSFAVALACACVIGILLGAWGLDAIQPIPADGCLRINGAELDWPGHSGGIVCAPPGVTYDIVVKPKTVEVPVIRDVPGPERIVTKEVPGPATTVFVPVLSTPLRALPSLTRCLNVLSLHGITCVPGDEQ